MSDEGQAGPEASRPAGAGSGAVAGGPGVARVGPDARLRIGRDLRRLYGSILDQPLPERFTRLVAELAGDGEDGEGAR